MKKTIIGPTGFLGQMKHVKVISEQVSVKILMNALKAIVEIKNNALILVAVTNVIVDCHIWAETVKSKLQMSH